MGFLSGSIVTIADQEDADDIAILQTDESSTQALLGQLAANADNIGLSIKLAKTKVLIATSPAVIQSYRERRTHRDGLKLLN